MPKENCIKRFVKYFVLFENKTKYLLSTIKKRRVYGVKLQKGGVRNFLGFFQRLLIINVCFFKCLKKNSANTFHM